MTSEREAFDTNFDADWEHHVDSQVEGPDPDDDLESFLAECDKAIDDWEGVSEPKARQGEIGQ